MPQRTTVTVDGHDIEISKLDKELYPHDGITKGDVVDYFQAVAEAMLTHIADRPLTMVRFPDGIDAEGFFQKEASEHFPDWVRTVDVPVRGGGKPVRQVVCNDAATLVYLANQACLEFHVGLAKVDDLEHPDRFVVDVDPPADVELSDLRNAVRRVKDAFEEVGLTPFVQLTGGRGFHVVAALDGSASFDDVLPFARTFASHIAEQDPDHLTVEQRKEKRGDRIFLDVNRNAYGQTAIAPYSLRAREGASVATPIEWKELGRVEPGCVHVDSVRRRLSQKQDPWSGLGRQAASLRDVARRLTSS